ncbi:MAG: hypothetical protein COT73_02365 [Bdellovibrio sp. CG10_big_fil_rev_8_21_14_0_10_47_8]|nr:MAG: hypothetical protein COT73_02365 [Bdellovibrio sp. CG10_big_fil_rev_8_21_14_0_10_47_8]
MSGSILFETLVEGTGLPSEYVRNRLERLIERHGYTVQGLSVDQARELASSLLLDLIQESLQEQ